MGTGSDIMMQELEELMGMGLASMLLSEIPAMLINLAIYILTALGLYTIAKRRGINKPWLAWIPFCNVWLLGCISDQYRSVARGEVKSRRKALLGLDITQTVLAIAVVALMLSVLFGVVVDLLEIGIENLDTLDENAVLEILMPMLSSMVGVLLLAIPLMVVAIIYLVFYYIALHDIFKSCDPNNATLYLVLSIVVGVFTNMIFGIPGTAITAIFLLVCRNKDDGMPPKEPQPPVYGYQPPVYGQPPIYGQPPVPPQWQPPQTPVPPAPPAEPWERSEE